ncbi:MAG: NAD(+) synthase [Eubacterium sp.]|nr:NAD(+) synthase [Eubacterium sp.]MDD6568669.1 NAD(+) synthase [Eubacteriales bacterium]MDY4111027.1 NAD(+) synthase [Eubacterium sp.]
MNYGFIKTAASSLKLKVADVSFNVSMIKETIDNALERGVRLLVTPELSITGYTCADLFFSRTLLVESERAVGELADYIKGKDIVLLVGAPVAFFNKLYNCAIVIDKDGVKGIVPKKYLANYNEFYEKRWFASGFDFKEAQDISFAGFDTQIGDIIFDLGDGAVLGVELCEDLWVPNPPSSSLALNGANIIANLSASDEYVSKAEYRRDLVLNQCARCVCAYVYSGASVFESTTDLVFSGATLVCENGAILNEGERFKRENVLTVADIDVEKLSSQRRSNMSFENSGDEIKIVKLNLENKNNDLEDRFVDSMPFVPSDNEKRAQRCKEIFSIQASGLAKRIEHVGSSGVVVGISGGLDSTLALLVSVSAMKLLGKDNSDILGVTMPGFGTTDRTYQNAIDLMKSLGVTIKEISIKDACILHMKDIEHDSAVKDITYENTQARERTQILFDLANKHGKLLVGTGDLSELAMGWCTYNGDHMSMYGVNASVPKTLVKYLVEYVANISDKKTADILFDVLDTPVSPELLPPDENGNIAQKTEDNIGPYELHDFFLYNFVRFGFEKNKIKILALKAFDGKYDENTISKWLSVFIKRFFISQFKRSCIPDSPKVGSVSLSPRGDWRMPSDASFNAFI